MLIFPYTGFAGTYKGLAPTILKQGTNQAIRFFVYMNLKHYFQDGDNSKDIGNIRTFFIGGIAGAASVFGNTPIDVVKTRMQVSEWYQMFAYGRGMRKVCEWWGVKCVSGEGWSVRVVMGEVCEWWGVKCVSGDGWSVWVVRGEVCEWWGVRVEVWGNFSKIKKQEKIWTLIYRWGDIVSTHQEECYIALQSAGIMSPVAF